MKKQVALIDSIIRCIFMWRNSALTKVVVTVLKTGNQKIIIFNYNEWCLGQVASAINSAQWGARLILHPLSQRHKVTQTLCVIFTLAN